MLPLSFFSADLPLTGSDARVLLATREGAADAILWQLDEPPAAVAPERWREIAAESVAGGLLPFAALDIARFPIDHPLVAGHEAAFALRLDPVAGPLDPRRPAAPVGEAIARFEGEPAAALVASIAASIRGMVDGGVRGLVLARSERLTPAWLESLKAAVGAAPLSWLGSGAVTPAHGRAFIAAGLDGWIGSLADRAWLAPGSRLIATDGDLIAAAALADGIVIPIDTASGRIEAARAVLRRAADFPGERRLLSPAPRLLVLRSAVPDLRHAEEALMIAASSDADAYTLDPQPVTAAGFSAEAATLAPDEVAIARVARPEAAGGWPVPAATAAAEAPRLVVEELQPRVDGGDFPIKRVVGDTVAATALVYADGHEQLAAELLWRALGDEAWQRAPMVQQPNDLWTADFGLPRIGRFEFLVEGWLDRFGGYQRDFGKKLAADVALPVDYAEGRLLVREADLADWSKRLEAAADTPQGAELLLSPELQVAMRAADPRLHATRSPRQLVDAERLQARFSSWYELFPRSVTDDKARHGTFRDVIGRLPAVRDMGFDTLYFPPIHPIGAANRKGPNNTLTPAPHDVGSPYAIGAPEGGHDAIHPALGDFDDFRALVAAAREQGLEIALDFAIQASPDHPWLTEHPGWFAWRPDGSMKYAENPPKKYQDIVNVDFYGPDAVPALWQALRDVVLLWIENGVLTFRVDNPHTKPLPFWEWMIADVRSRHPEAIFLAEAFTRPTMMYRLAKIGFSQSYTYFTWRDGKQELIDYVTELTTAAPREFYRPHFFVNTPDINPVYLQTSGRPGFRIRAVLAATLSGLFGVYSGFELCEAAPIPGKEEYLDSEKYEIRVRDYAAPGNIVADITLLNRLRRDNPALQTHLNTRFYTATNDNIIYYGKPAPDGREMILVMVNLDPHAPHECAFDVPLWEFGLDDNGSVDVEDLAGGYRFRWYGKTQTIRLDPTEPYRIWRIRA